eukprot:349771-Chlamydomonas_euryale.AAC.2
MRPSEPEHALHAPAMHPSEPTHTLHARACAPMCPLTPFVCAACCRAAAQRWRMLSCWQRTCLQSGHRRLGSSWSVRSGVAGVGCGSRVWESELRNAVFLRTFLPPGEGGPSSSALNPQP